MQIRKCRASVVIWNLAQGLGGTKGARVVAVRQSLADWPLLRLDRFGESEDCYQSRVGICN